MTEDGKVKSGVYVGETVTGVEGEVPPHAFMVDAWATGSFGFAGLFKFLGVEVPPPPTDPPAEAETPAES